MKSIELYYWPTPNGYKISIALEEMQLPYVLKPIAIGKGEQFTPEFLAISPNNRIPAIVDPKGPGGKPISVFESAPILQYLGRKTGKLYPRDERKRIAVDEWLAWQVANVGPMFGQASHFKNYARNLTGDPSKIEYSVERYNKEVNRLCGVLEHRLTRRDFICDEYTIADIANFPWVRVANAFVQDMSPFPRVNAWIERIGARPAVKRGLDVGKDLRRPPPAPGSAEAQESAKILFGQTAASVDASTQANKH